MRKSKVNRKPGDDSRFALVIKYWREDNPDFNTEATMTTDSLRAARNEFRSRLRDVLSPAEISREVMAEIVKAGYVVAAGPVDVLYDHFAMVLVDRKNGKQPLGMYAFDFNGDGWSIKYFTP